MDAPFLLLCVFCRKDNNSMSAKTKWAFYNLGQRALGEKRIYPPPAQLRQKLVHISPAFAVAVACLQIINPVHLGLY